MTIQSSQMYGHSGGKIIFLRTPSSFIVSLRRRMERPFTQRTQQHKGGTTLLLAVCVRALLSKTDFLESLPPEHIRLLELYIIL